MSIFIPEKISRKWMNMPSEGIMVPDKENLELAHDYCLEMWRQRAAERGISKPEDLSYSCKFTSLFTKMIFGGRISGNEYHQFVVHDDYGIIDLNRNAKDVKDLSNPYEEDSKFIGSKDHCESMSSCVPRIQKWINEFDANHKTRFQPP